MINQLHITYAHIKLKLRKLFGTFSSQILMNAPLAIHVGMVHAPMLLGVLNATAMKALSQGLWWIVKASDTFLNYYFYRKHFSLSQLLLLWLWYSTDDYVPHKYLFLYPGEHSSSCYFKALVWQHLGHLRVGISGGIFHLKLSFHFLGSSAG